MSGGTGGVSIFSQAALDQLVEQAIPSDLPEGHNSAIVGTVDQEGAQVVIGFNRDAAGGTWEASGAFRHTWAGDNQVGARLIYSW